jgi:hypothetical protein
MAGIKPNFAIKETRVKDGFKVLTVDTNKATYQGKAWKTLGNIGKGIFEDLLVLQNISDGLVKVLYV